MRVVVTGLSGNIGTALLRLLAADDDVEPVGVVRRPPPLSERIHARAGWVALDLADDTAGPALTTVLQRADAVVHLAWPFQPARDADYLDAASVGATARLVAAVQAVGTPHLVHMSSLGVYSPAADASVRVSEDHPRDGIDTLPYSRQKVAAERLLDEAGPDLAAAGTTVTRLRPGLVLQREAGSALLRYGTPAWFPPGLLRLLPVLPLDGGLQFPVVHARDVAAAVVAVLRRRAGGAFNLAAEPPVTADDVAAALHAARVPVPMPALRSAAAAAWHLRLSPLDPGWLDLAAAVPLMDTTRARTELGWEPAVDARDALREAVEGMVGRRGTSSPVLRPRHVAGTVARAVVRGPVTRRRRP